MTCFKKNGHIHILKVRERRGVGTARGRVKSLRDNKGLKYSGRMEDLGMRACWVLYRAQLK